MFTLYADVKERRRPSRRLKVVVRRGRPGVGLTGLEPVTLRLSSACSNQLSYRPEKIAEARGVAALPPFH